MVDRAHPNVPPLSGETKSRELLRRAWHWSAELYRCLDEGRTFGLAAETAFWLFLAMVPLAAVGGLVAARLSLGNWQDLTPVLGSLPWDTRQMIEKELVSVSRWNGGTVGVAGAAAFVWAASSGIQAIFEALEIEAGAARSWIRKRVIALGTCVAFSLSVCVLALLGPGVEAVAAFLGRSIPGFEFVSAAVSTVGRALRVFVGLGIAFGTTCLLYRFGVPKVARQSVPVVPGALFAVGSQAMLSFLYGFYVSKLGGAEAYGTSLAIVAITLTALYLFAVSLLIGAVINRRIGVPAAPCPASPPPRPRTEPQKGNAA